jgi:acyl-CoA synthetase (AMP-forming)/AMP-acid ligase II
MSFTKLLEWSASRHSDRVAFVYEGRSRTFAEVEERARRLANGLSRAGVSKGDRVITLSGNRPEYFEAEMALAKLGAVRVPALVNLPPAEIQTLMNLTEPVAVFATDESIDSAREALATCDPAPKLITTAPPEDGDVGFEDLIAGSTDDPLQVTVTPEDLYAIRFTGGTTGDPKGVEMDHRGMTQTMINLMLGCPINREDVGLHVHPLSHASGFWGYMYWLRGARSVILPAFGFDPHAVLREIETNSITCTYLVPATIYRLLDAVQDSDADVSSLSTIYYGAAPIAPARLSQALQQIGTKFIQTYGLSEAPVLVSTLDPDDHLDVDSERLGSVGRPVMNVEVVIRDDDGKPVVAGTAGEVTVRSTSAMRGYWRNERLTGERLRDGWVYTRDMGYLDDDGYLFLVDRKEDMIITGGFNVFPSEVEECIYEHEGVREAVVFGVADDTWGEAVTAIVVPRVEDSVEAEELREFLTVRLVKYKVPKRLVIREQELPKSAIGKMLRRKAREELLGTGTAVGD